MQTTRRNRICCILLFDVKKKKEQSHLNKTLKFNEQRNFKVMERRKSAIVLRT